MNYKDHPKMISLLDRHERELSDLQWELETLDGLPKGIPIDPAEVRALPKGNAMIYYRIKDLNHGLAIARAFSLENTPIPTVFEGCLFWALDDPNAKGDKLYSPIQLRCSSDGKWYIEWHTEKYLIMIETDSLPSHLVGYRYEDESNGKIIRTKWVPGVFPFEIIQSYSRVRPELPNPYAFGLPADWTPVRFFAELSAKETT